MARKRKNRTHLKGVNRDEPDAKTPKSFVIKSGQVGASVTQLVRDIRKIMEPGTATRLRERASARLRDYLTMAPALNVTHLLVLTLSEKTSSLHLRLARLPAGPTLTFRIERYSLMKDLVNARSRNVGHSPGGEFRTPPLLVLSNFNPPPGEKPQPQLKLMSTMFQGMFPPIQIDKSALPSFRRVLLISYHAPTHLVSVRHYTISIRPSGVSRRVRRVLDSSSSAPLKKPLDLGDDQDIADYLLKTGNRAASEGYETGSETEGESEAEGEAGTSRVELPADYVGRGNKKGSHRAVRLIEMGPRIEMRLVKVVEGIVGSLRGEGETVFHEFVSKTAAEKSDLKKTHLARQTEKTARRKEQEANVARKKEAASALKTSKRGGARGKSEDAAADANAEGGGGSGDEDEDEDEVVHDYTGEEEFEFEDRVLKGKKGKGRADEMSESEEEESDEGDDEEDHLDLDGDDEAGDVSESEDEIDDGGEGAMESSEDDEPAAPPPKRTKAPVGGKVGKGKGRK